MTRVAFGGNDQPLIVRAQRVPLSLTRASIELACTVVLGELARVEHTQGQIQRGAPATSADRCRLAARRIALIDALAELRGQR